MDFIEKIAPYIKDEHVLIILEAHHDKLLNHIKYKNIEGQYKEFGFLCGFIWSLYLYNKDLLFKTLDEILNSLASLM